MQCKTTTEIIRIRLDAAHTTTPMDWYSQSKLFGESVRNLTSLIPAHGTTNGTTNVTVVSSPASGSHKLCTGLDITNLDTVTHSITVEFYDGTNARRIHRATLLPGQKLQYDRGRWNIFSVAGVYISTQGNDGSNGTDGMTLFAPISQNAVHNWLGPIAGYSTVANATLFANQRYDIPVYVRKQRDFTKIGVVVQTAVAGHNVRLGIRNMDQDTAQPTTLIVDAGEAATDTNGTKELAITETLSAGWYYLEAVASANVSVRAANTWLPLLGWQIGSINAIPSSQLTKSFAYGPLASDLTGTTDNAIHHTTAIPVLGIR